MCHPALRLASLFEFLSESDFRNLQFGVGMDEAACNVDVESKAEVTDASSPKERKHASPLLERVLLVKGVRTAVSTVGVS
jgi:hypothetical protein